VSGAAEAVPQVNSCDPIEEMPVFEMLIEPNWFVKVIVSAQAASGNTKASSARTNTRLIFLPSVFLFFPRFTLKD
jgi:hypothetical protein